MDILKVPYLNLPYFMLLFDLDVNAKPSKNSKNLSTDRSKIPTNTNLVSKGALNFELEFFNRF